MQLAVDNSNLVEEVASPEDAGGYKILDYVIRR
jgi:hypothetical protein